MAENTITVVERGGKESQTTIIKMSDSWLDELFEWLDNHGFGPNEDGVWVEDAPVWDCAIDIMKGEDAKCPRGYEYSGTGCRGCEFHKTEEEIEAIVDARDEND